MSHRTLVDRLRNYRQFDNCTEAADRIELLEQQRDTLLALIKRYRKETPIGNQPHMIAHQADEAISAIESSIKRAA